MVMLMAIYCTIEETVPQFNLFMNEICT